MNHKEQIIRLLHNMKGKATIGDVADAILDWHNVQQVFSFSSNLQNKEELNVLDPHFDGKAYEKELDQKRLNKGIKKVFILMNDDKFHSLKEISERTGVPEASVSAHIRSFRKEEWGAHTVDRIRHKDGLFLYKLIPNKNSFTYQNLMLSKEGGQISCSGEIL